MLENGLACVCDIYGWCTKWVSLFSYNDNNWLAWVKVIILLVLFLVFSNLWNLLNIWHTNSSSFFTSIIFHALIKSNSSMNQLTVYMIIWNANVILYKKLSPWYIDFNFIVVDIIDPEWPPLPVLCQLCLGRFDHLIGRKYWSRGDDTTLALVIWHARYEFRGYCRQGAWKLCRNQ